MQRLAAPLQLTLPAIIPPVALIALVTIVAAIRTIIPIVPVPVWSAPVIVVALSRTMVLSQSRRHITMLHHPPRTVEARPRRPVIVVPAVIGVVVVVEVRVTHVDIHAQIIIPAPVTIGRRRIMPAVARVIVITTIPRRNGAGRQRQDQGDQDPNSEEPHLPASTAGRSLLEY
ncbi:hypothetical protein D3C78_1139310 [compost metagenome]